ncbi:hypothetical protein S40285_07009 [Stachybotrys chlorohalonatus IBT 40285]|uniref:Serine hydrolase domain-containing protein n=1 Tax=Stachybotrys chlorohalonatus (strain IBT 40285) TaxID=1283841 RepID=A0A084QYC5_STAC4|nr:hypothetical protein S40285_07009 [Stachybotrys chlorohalonata IBT 40285]
MIVEHSDDTTRHLPRILCLHGGGTNARIFRMQCRVLKKQLASSFRLVFAEAPFLSEAGPDVVSVYRDYGPFKRWLRWLPTHPPLKADDVIAAVDQSLDVAMCEDDEQGATGDWVAILGFSQGAKVAASILLRQQMINQGFGTRKSTTNFKFAILIAGRGPLVMMEPGLAVPSTALIDASQNSLHSMPNEQIPFWGPHILSIPTIHVHGLRDVNINLHRQLLERYCDPMSAVLVEWDGEHRVPIKAKDVTAITDEIYRVARDTGVLEY